MMRAFRGLNLLARGVLAALALVAWGLPGQARAASGGTEQLADGTELLVVARPGAPLASFRFVVRSGATNDPTGKAGLAHVLEHLVFQGSQDVAGPEFLARAHAMGGIVNAHTSAQSTIYALDAPREAFLPLVKDFLRIITSPQLPGGELLSRELGIIQMENLYHPPHAGLLRFVEEALFQGAAVEASIIGTRESRERIKREDLIEFFNNHYVTSNVSIVFSGDVTAQDARAAVDAAYRLPPALPEEKVAPRFQRADYPIVSSTRAPSMLMVFGYPVERGDRQVCRSVADLLRLRLLLSLHVREPLVSSLQVECLSLRGNDLLLAFASTPTLEDTELPMMLAAAFQELAKRPPTAAERKLLARRGERRAQLLAASGTALADVLAAAAAEPRAEGLTDLELLDAPPSLTPAQVKDLVRRNFREEREVRITFSPFEG